MRIGSIEIGIQATMVQCWFLCWIRDISHKWQQKTVLCGFKLIVFIGLAKYSLVSLVKVLKYFQKTGSFQILLLTSLVAMTLCPSFVCDYYLVKVFIYRFLQKSSKSPGFIYLVPMRSAKSVSCIMQMTQGVSFIHFSNSQRAQPVRKTREPDTECNVDSGFSSLCSRFTGVFRKKWGGRMLRSMHKIWGMKRVQILDLKLNKLWVLLYYIALSLTSLVTLCLTFYILNLLCTRAVCSLTSGLVGLCRCSWCRRRWCWKKLKHHSLFRVKGWVEIN